MLSADQDEVSFDEDDHVYRIRGEKRPSVTETLKSGGLFDYSRVPPDLLEFKRKLGKRVHAWTAEYDRERDVDLCDLTRDEQGYAEGWLACRAKHPEMELVEIETPMVRPILGVEVGGTPDRIVKIRRLLYILDLKCVASFHAPWKLQLADYGMMRTGRPTCNAIGRIIVRLRKDGHFHFDPIDSANDAVDSTIAIAFLQTHVWKQNHRLL